MSNFGFAVREGFCNFWRDRTLSLAMAGSVAIAVFAVGAVALIVVNINFVLKEWENKVELVAFLRHDVGPEQAQHLLERVGLLPQVREARLLSGHDSWAQLFSEAGGSLNLGDVSLGEILPPTIVIKLSAGNYELPQVRQLSAKIGEMDGVDEVKFEDLLLVRYLRFRRELTSVAVGMNIFWLLIFGIVTVNIARLASAARSREVQAMHILGASSRLLRKISAVEGLMQGLVGGGAGIAILSGISLLLSGKVGRSLQFPPGVFAAAFALGPCLALLANWCMFRKAAITFVVVLALVLPAGVPRAADDLDAEVAHYQQEIERLRNELRQNKSAAERIVAQEHTIIEELEQIEKEIDTLEKNAGIAKRKMIINKSSIHDGQEQLVQFEKELADSRQELEQWLKVLSVRRMPSIAEVVFFDIPQSEITLRNQIISLLAQKQAQASAHVEELRAQYAQQQDDLRKRAELDTLYIDTMNLRMQQSLEKKQQRESLLAALRQQKSIYMAAINDLEASSRNLQRLIDSTQPQQIASRPVSASVPFREMKGLLVWPVEGEVIALFGRIQNPDSQTYTRHLGIDISAPAGSEIRVIHDGEVIYCDWFRGYGKLVILDHGDGYSSIYSHCSEILVKKGDFIPAGTPLALVGETGSLKGPFLYFEIRENGQPVDPLAWLQRRM